MENLLSVFILLDRSGSMSNKWEESISSINNYVDVLKKEEVNAKITVASFDSPTLFSFATMKNEINEEWFNILRNSVDIESYNNISSTEVFPRGATALYDATGKLLNLADNENSEKTVILIMTDGEENSSVNYNLSAIRDRINTCQKRNWEVIFLGAEFNVERTALNYGLSDKKFFNVDNIKELSHSMRLYASASASYAKFNKSIDATKLKV